MRGPASRRNRYIYSLEFPNGPPFEQPAPPARFDIRTQVARSSGPGPARTYRRRIRAARRVQLARERQETHTPAPIRGEIEPREEFNSPENVKKLTFLRSRLVERTTRDQKELSALDLGLFITTVDCIFDPLPSSLVQLPTPISAGPSILLTPPSLFNRIITLQARLEKARYELALLPRCLPLPDDQELTESTDRQIAKEKKHIDHQ